MRKYSKGKVTFLPGWMDLSKLHPEFYGLEIWKEDLDPNEKIESEYLVGNSLGCHFALLNWRENRNTKLILINPLLERKAFLIWMWRWLRFFVHEGRKHFNLEKVQSYSNPLRMIGLARRFLRDDYWKIILEIPKKDLLIVRGSKDDFFCDRVLADKIRGCNIPFLEISDMGHAWESEYADELEKFIV